MMKKTGVLGGITVVALLLFILIPNVLMVQRPRQFYLDDSSQVNERKQLLSTLQEKIAEMKASDTEPKEWGYLYDSDALWPMDTYTIVIALERYILEEGKIPSSIDSLYSRNFLSPSEVNGGYVLELEEDNWKLKRDKSFVLVAEGN